MKNRIGRPVGGVTKFSEALIARLPKEGSIREFATVLSISEKAIHVWIEKGAPARQIESQRWRILKAEFVQWMRDGGRVN